MYSTTHDWNEKYKIEKKSNEWNEWYGGGGGGPSCFTVKEFSNNNIF